MRRMESVIEDILSADLIFLGVGLINSPESFEQFKASLDTEIQAEVGILANVSGGSSGIGAVPETAHRFLLNRDRILLDILPNVRSSITRQYPSNANSSTDFARLAEVVACAFECTDFSNQQLTAFGYNLRYVLAPELSEPAISYLGKRLFDGQSLGKRGWETFGGMGSILFLDGIRRWTFNVEPRPRDNYESRKLFLHLNLHLESSERPSEQDINVAFAEMKEEVDNFVRRLIDVG